MSHEEEFARVAALMEQENAIFVFGSNNLGVHGAGAAKTAYEQYGAELGVSEGLMGRSYGIPTKNAPSDIESLPWETIKTNVQTFIDFARAHPELIFAVTRVGCGLAGRTDRQVRPLFRGAPDNVKLPLGWDLPPRPYDVFLNSKIEG